MCSFALKQFTENNDFWERYDEKTGDYIEEAEWQLRKSYKENNE